MDKGSPYHQSFLADQIGSASSSSNNRNMLLCVTLCAHLFHVDQL